MEIENFKLKMEKHVGKRKTNCLGQRRKNAGGRLVMRMEHMLPGIAKFRICGREAPLRLEQIDFQIPVFEYVLMCGCRLFWFYGKTENHSGSGDLWGEFN